LNIVSYEHMGVFRLGVTREENRANAIAQGAYKEFTQTFTRTVHIDSYDETGVNVHYNEQGICEAIEAFGPEPPMYKDFVFLGMPFHQAKAILLNEDPDLYIDTDGVISEKVGISLYIEDEDEPVLAVMIFQEGYYDSIRHLLKKG